MLPWERRAVMPDDLDQRDAGLAVGRRDVVFEEVGHGGGVLPAPRAGEAEAAPPSTPVYCQTLPTPLRLPTYIVSRNTVWPTVSEPRWRCSTAWAARRSRSARSVTRPPRPRPAPRRPPAASPAGSARRRPARCRRWRADPPAAEPRFGQLPGDRARPLGRMLHRVGDDLVPQRRADAGLTRAGCVPAGRGLGTTPPPRTACTDPSARTAATASSPTGGPPPPWSPRHARPGPARACAAVPGCASEPWAPRLRQLADRRNETGHGSAHAAGGAPSVGADLGQ